jgi:hypothetical protein
MTHLIDVIYKIIMGIFHAIWEFISWLFHLIF